MFLIHRQTSNPLGTHFFDVVFFAWKVLKDHSQNFGNYSCHLHSGSQIEISIMKSVSEHQCEWFLIYDHDDLSNLDIEINFLKKIVFQEEISSNKASKKRLKEILKKIGKENEFWKKFHRIRIFCLDEFWYDDRYWKASPGSTLNDFNNGLAIFYDWSSFFNKI